MVNSKKKMNKSTVAIVVLALLLVLSLVLTATGAWFTSNKESTASDASAAFGKVSIKDISDDAFKAGEWQGVDNEKVLPGSSIAVTGGTIENESDVKVYVKLGITSAITVAGKTLDLNAEVTKENGVALETSKKVSDYFTISNLTVKDLTVVGGTNVYLLEVGTNVEVNGASVIVKTSLPNTLTIGGEDITFNGNTEGIVLNMQVKVAAIQAQNMTGENAGAQAAAAEVLLNAILNPAG